MREEQRLEARPGGSRAFPERSSSFPPATALRVSGRSIICKDFSVSVFPYNTRSNKNQKLDTAELESPVTACGLKGVSLFLCELIIPSYCPSQPPHLPKAFCTLGRCHPRGEAPPLPFPPGAESVRKPQWPWLQTRRGTTVFYLQTVVLTVTIPVFSKTPHW